LRQARRIAISWAKSQQSSLDLVHPGAADLSYLVHKLRGSQLSMHGSGARMPLDGSLEASGLEAIISWIESGARDN
jgi:hypothetical protein